MPDEDCENFGGFLVFEKPTYCSKSVVEFSAVFVTG